MSKVKDTDFLHISPRIKIMEMKLLTNEDIQRMLNALSNEDAAKIIVDKGYQSFDSSDISSLEKSLEKSMEALYAFLEPHMPNHYFIDFFKIKNDYSNMKAVIKGDALGADIDDMLSKNGIYSCEKIKDIIRDSSFEGVYSEMQMGIENAREILARTKDPQFSDIALDMAMYKHMVYLAEQSGSEFLINYMKLLIDGDNLRAAVRVQRMNKNNEFMEKVIAKGGNLPKELFLENDLNLVGIYRNSPLELGAKMGENIISGQSPFAPLDLFVDNSLMEYAKTAKNISFGDKTVLGYVVAREREINQIRAIMIGRLSKRPKEKITESLRINYV